MKVKTFNGELNMPDDLLKTDGHIKPRPPMIKLREPNLWFPVGTRPVTQYLNICIWWDRTIVPMKGHKGNCLWKFDGQIWRHL